MVEMHYKEVDVVRNIGFPVATIDMVLTQDKKRLLLTGTYKPSIKMYDLANYTTKYERHLVAEPIRLEPLTADAEKFCILRTDRTIEFHNKTGFHADIHIPHAGRDILYNCYTAELLVSGNFKGVYRFNTEQGRFLKPIDIPQISELAISAAHGLVAGISESRVHFIDLRAKEEVLCAPLEGGISQTVDIHENGVKYIVGTDSGFLYEYDIRSPRENLNSILLNNSIQEARYNGKYILLASGDKLAVLNEKRNLSTIDCQFQIASFVFNEGLIIAGGESDKLKSFYISEIGRAPVWCSNIEYE